MELDGYDDAQINTPDMVTNAWLAKSRDCSSTGANLEMLNWIGIQFDAKDIKSLSYVT